MFCESLCATLDQMCPFEPGRSLRSLDPYDHLRRFLRLCVSHFKRNVLELRSSITKEVQQAMLSLASSQPHPNLEGTFEIIEKGGKKAAGKFNSRFLFVALFILFPQLGSKTNVLEANLCYRPSINRSVLSP